MKRLGAALILVCAAAMTIAGKLNVAYTCGKPWSVVVNGMATTSDAKTKEIVVEVPDGKPETMVEVHLTSDNLIAKKSLKECGTIWKVDEKEFTFLTEVHLELTNAEGAPLSSGTVEVSSGKFKQSLDLTAADKGAIKFNSVPMGPATVKVSRLPVLDASSPKEMSIVVKLLGGPESTKPIPIKIGFAVDTVDTVDTVDAPKKPDSEPSAGKPTASTEPKPDQPEAKPSGGGNSFFPMLLGLAAIGAAVFFGWKYLLQNKDKLAAEAAKHGFHIPGDDGAADPAAAPAVPVQPAKSAPVEPIMLPDAGPIDLGSAAAPAAVIQQPVSSVSQEPSMILASGQTLTIPEGLHVVSREPGSPLSLLGEASVSRNHAEIRREGAVVSVRDLGSTNGTYVNGNRIDSEVVLKNGDALQFGQAAMRFQG